MNITEFSITVRSTRFSDRFRPSAPTPEISDTYPGTSGSTQGERNESKPARNAAMGNGRFAILGYCTRPERLTDALREYVHRRERDLVPARRAHL